MGDYDFTYRIPESFKKRIIQFLQQSEKINVAKAFFRCDYEYEVLNYAYYYGFNRGDNWHKKAVDWC